MAVSSQMTNLDPMIYCHTMEFHQTELSLNPSFNEVQNALQFRNNVSKVARAVAPIQNSDRGSVPRFLFHVRY